MREPVKHVIKNCYQIKHACHIGNSTDEETSLGATLGKNKRNSE